MARPVFCSKASSIMAKIRMCPKRNINFQHAMVASILLSPFGPSLLLAQQLPRYNTSKFDYSVSYKTNVCSRSALLQNDTMDDWRDALRGLELSAALYFGPQQDSLFNFDDEGRLSGDYPGLAAEIMDMVAKRAGFKWRNNFGTYTDLEPDKNKTWADLLEWSVEVYDISATYFCKTIDRLNRGISFPHGWYDGSIILVQKGKTEKESFYMWSFTGPFDAWVWFFIVASIFATGIMYWFLEWLDNDRADNLRQSPLHAVFLAAIGFTQHFEFRPNTAAAMLLSWSWSFWSLITAACYTANLASHLVTRNEAVKAYDNLNHAVRARATICILRFTDIDDYVTKKFPKAQNFQRYQSYRFLFEALEKGECSAVLTGANSLDQFKRNMTLNSDCTWKTIGRAESIVPAGFATKVDTHGPYCTSLISHVLDLHLLEMEADGNISRAWDRYLTRDFGQDTCGQSGSDSTDDSTHNRLDVKDMGGIFVFHYSLCAIALSYAYTVWFRKKRLTMKQIMETNDNDNALNESLSKKKDQDVRETWVKGWFSKNRLKGEQEGVGRSSKIGLKKEQTVEANDVGDALNEPLC